MGSAPSCPPARILISLLHWELTETGPGRLQICIPTLGTRYLSRKSFRMNSWEAVKFSPLFSRVYLCNQGQCYGLYIWVKTRALQPLQTSFPRPGTYGCPSAKCNLRKSQVIQAQSLYSLYFNCVSILVSWVSSFPKISEAGLLRPMKELICFTLIPLGFLT